MTEELKDPTTGEQRNRRKTRTGVVVSDRGDKTVVVYETRSGFSPVSPRTVIAARYNADGTPDNSFGSSSSNNQVYVSSVLNQISGIAVDPSGDLVVGACRLSKKN